MYVYLNFHNLHFKYVCTNKYILMLLRKDFVTNLFSCFHHPHEFLFYFRWERETLPTGSPVSSIARPTQYFLLIFGKVIQGISVSVVLNTKSLNFKHHLWSAQIRTKTTQMTWVLIIRMHHITEINCMYWNSRDRFKGTRGERVSQANVGS